MTQAKGTSTIHETVYENRFGYAPELRKMGAKLSYFKPKVENPKEFYNFNFHDQDRDNKQALKIVGQTPLHNAVLNISDLRAGATLVIGALIARGTSIVYGVEYLERGYEAFDARLSKLGASIRLEEEEIEI
jgi:UDP-N-acetylglucosamine 1-carboxyvinyltransferase